MPKTPQKRRDSRAFTAMCEALFARGASVRFRASGRSMEPNIFDEDALIVSPPIAAGARRGQIAFTHGENGYRAHRVVANFPNKSNEVVTRGDSGLANDPDGSVVLGKVISIERGQRKLAAAGRSSRLIHAARRRSYQAWRAARRRGSSPLLAAILLAFLSLLGATPASATLGWTVSITSPANNSSVAPQDTVTYAITLTNTSTGNNNTTIDGVSLTMADPNFMTFSSAAQSGGSDTWNCANAGTPLTVTCTIQGGGGFTKGQSSTFNFAFTVNPGTAGDSSTATAKASSSNLATVTSAVTLNIVAPTLTVTNTAAPTPISPGDNLTYTIGLSNSSGVNAVANETVSMPDPANTSFVSAAATSGTGTWNCANASGTVTCTDTANYATGSATTFKFVFTVNAATSNGTVIPAMTATAAAANTTSNATANSNTVTVQAPDISVSNTPNPTSQVATGGTITYTQVLTNNGAEESVGASFTETTPTNTTFNSYTAPAGSWTCTAPGANGTGTIICTANAGTVIAAGGTATLTVVVNVNLGPSVAGSTISDTVTVGETGTDPNTANNTATASVSVAGADLAMTQLASPAVLAPTGTITYTETVSNNGPSAATNVTLYQQTPPNTTFSSVTYPSGWACGTVPASGATGQIICTIASLAANTTTTNFVITVTVNSGANAPAAGTTIQNYADVTSTTADPVVSNNSTTSSVLVETTGDADLGIIGGASPTPVFIDSTLIYTLQVTNYGLTATTGTTVTDTLPTGVTYVSASSTQGTCAQASGVVTCSLGAVAYAPSSPITITITVTTPGTATTLTNKASVSSTSPTDPVSTNNNVSVLTVVQPLVCAMPGKDGAGGTLTGIVNAYYPPASGVTSVSAGSISVQLGPASGASTAISPGDLLLFIQMQGATINSTNTGAYGDGVPGDPGSGSTSIGNSGEYEFVTATSSVPATGGTLAFIGTGATLNGNPNSGLLNTYTNTVATSTQGQTTFQVIRVPQYSSAVLSSSLTALSWNGTVGGVLALDVSSQLTLSGTVSLDGEGFRGGGGRILTGGTGAGTDYVTLSTDKTNGSKAEGIAGTPTYISPAQSSITLSTTATATNQTYVEGIPSGSYARGAPGNAGGGATDANPPSNNQNSGGGGGGNGGNGGEGGFGWSSAGIVGGFGGVAFPASTSALVMGGGGGAGTSNDGAYWLPASETGGADCGANCTGIYSSGTAGGGIAIIRAGSVSGTGTITANGLTALEVENDGGGGGGAGGSILFFTNSGGLSGLTVQANGGGGGVTWPENTPSTPFPGNRHGPGGGGGGGVALLTGSQATVYLLGGSPGYSTLADDAYGATPGQMGVPNTGLTVTQTPGTQSGAYCAGADLAVTNSANPTLVVSPSTITYTQSVTNNGPFDALNTAFSEAYPANTTFNTYSVSGASGWICNTAGSFSCTNPDLPAGSAGNTTFTVTVNVLSGITSGTQIIDTDSITSGTNDPNLTNNSATAVVLVAAAGTSDLSMSQMASPNPVAAGGAIQYVISITNNGPAAATNVSYSEAIPASPGYATFASLSCASGWTCTHPAVNGTGTVSGSIATLAAGGTASFTLTLNVSGTTPSGTIISETASVSSTTTDPNPENNSVTSNVTVASSGQYDLSVTTSASPNPVLPGDDITYTQTVANNGPASASNVVFTGSVPANTTFVSLGIPAGVVCTSLPSVGGTGLISCCPGSGNTCSGAAVPSGTQASIPMVVQVNPSTAPGTVISNTISVSPTSNDVTPSNNTATSTTVVASPTQADLAIVKTASPQPVDQGTNLTYTLQVTNNGPAVAQNVTVSDPLPSQVTYTSVSTTQGTCTQSSGTVSCSLGSLSVGSEVTIIINANAATFSSTTYATNTATVSSSTSDPNSANNSSSVTSTIEAPTAVQLSDFHAELEPQGGVLIEWHTKEEVRNLGFHLYREDATGRHRLDPSLIAGSALVLRGGFPQHAAKTYQWVDPNGTASSVYWVEDVDLNGTRTQHGPVQPGPASSGVTPSAQVARAALLADMNRIAMASAPGGHFNTVMPRPIILPRPVPPPDAPEVSNATLNGEPAVKISVSQTGWYSVTAQQLYAAGLTQRAEARMLQLYAEGVEQPMIVNSSSSVWLGQNGSIEFYGTGIDTPFSGTRVYWLVESTRPGLRISETAAQTSAPPSQTDFSATTLLEQRTTYFAALLNGENNDNFFGALITSEPVDQTLAAPNADPSSSIPVTMDVTLQGGTDQQQHSVSISFNGSYIGEMDFANQSNVTETFAVPNSLLQAGANTVTLAALNGDNDVSLVQSIALHYPHTYAADSDWLNATAPAGASLHITGFANPQIDVFDITDPLAVAQLMGRVTFDASGTYGISFETQGPAATQRTLVAFSSDQIAAPDALAYHAPNNLADAQTGASYVVISHPDFVSAAAPLVSLHQSEGQSTMVVTTDDIYDAFNYGEHSPFAIRSFLQLAAAKWRVAPQAVLLMGDASLDPRNYLGFGDLDFVPSRMIETQALKTASDDWLTDFNQTGYATIPTGRIPADTLQEAQLAVSKIVAFENGSNAGSWQQAATFVADQNVGDDFTAAAQTASQLVPSSLNVTKIFTDGEDPGVAQQQIVSAIDSGTLLVDYSGHGAEDQWSFNDFFDVTTIPSLTNGDRTPVFLLMDCLNGFFEDVYTTSMAEDLLFAPNGGAVAVWASSGFTDEPPQATMNQALLSTLSANPTMPIGEAILKAKSGITDNDVRQTWTLFGDPGMRIPFPQIPKNNVRPRQRPLATLSR
ncbi:MAG TPA: C25 family cysteine peptidase [Candidatus Aquilonibacter sp.]|nr:C25 family cysteine peptidase [Candidatus Aquilonibacter sp.]